MRETTGNPGVDLIEVTLKGGPASIPESARARRVGVLEEKIKIPHQGGYEHFERAADAAPGDASEIVYRWTMRTKPAE
ncbi:DUF5988 family protein [Amycolatopsis sp. NPDC059021]|uniref:DUF5988 family protein n=1 Tax=Amycolatopsis sp. NPDC059021 TaxID=3346704 RepID=UPI00366CBA4E